MLAKSEREEALLPGLAAAAGLEGDALAVARAAAPMAKADLATAVVTEFTSLAGVIGRHYADMEGHPQPVSPCSQEWVVHVRLACESFVVLVFAHAQGALRSFEIIGRHYDDTEGYPQPVTPRSYRPCQEWIVHARLAWEALVRCACPCSSGGFSHVRESTQAKLPDSGSASGGRCATPCLRRSSLASPATRCPARGRASCWQSPTGERQSWRRSQGATQTIQAHVLSTVALS